MMKILFARTAVALLFLAYPLVSEAQDAAEGAIRIDRNHSTVGFSVPVAGGISKVTGKFTEFTVDLVWDDDNPAASSVAVEIQVASVSTGYEGRDGDVRSESILDAENYPVITFVSHDIRHNGTGFVAVGDFTLHGVTKEIYLPITVVTLPDDEDPDDEWRAYHVTYQLDRSEYGIDWKHSSIDFFFGFDIEIDISILER
jgi:polyisoprenoid-binding protein YceI